MIVKLDSNGLSLSSGGGPERRPILKDLIDALYHRVADKWKVIGVLLEIPKGTLSRIADKHQRDPCSCLVEMLETWLERVYRCVVSNVPGSTTTSDAAQLTLSE